MTLPEGHVLEPLKHNDLTARREEGRFCGLQVD
jgi:hypothetical protein